MALRKLVRHQVLGALASGVVALLAFQNCSPVGFEQASEKAAGTLGDRDDDFIPATPEEDIVKKACEGAAIYTTTAKVNFPRPQAVYNGSRCNWEQDGNGSKLNGYFRARLEQAQTVSLPAGSKVCDVQFSSPTQDWRYDDHVFLTLNDVLIASSHPVHDKFTQRNGLSIYSWDKIYNQTWEQIPSYVWCEGMTSGLSTCSWPASETNGKIAMDFAPSLFKRIMALDLNRTSHEIKFVTSGDNDGAIDCDHSDLSFDVTVTYSK